jgi:hypothetical protein
MAKKRKQKISATNQKSEAQTGAKFPYTSKPASLRRLLKEIPKKPKPAKFNRDLLRSWGFGDTNDQTMIRVLKAARLINDSNEPMELYTRFMNLNDGAKALGPEIKRIYAPLFQASHAPYREGNETLQNLFNIHSGGGERSLEYQIQTFKALCENTTFDQSSSTGVVDSSLAVPAPEGASGVGAATGAAVVHINLHIHLPENKTRRDYEAVIEDIGRYIFGRNLSERRE